MSRSVHPFQEVAVGLAGRLAVRRRLSEIAAGVSSRLLGERFIVDQVDNAARHLAAQHPLRVAVADATRLARQLRADHHFGAPADYPDLVDELLLHSVWPSEPRTLVVVGGGVLARAVIAHPLARRYRQVLVVTRSPKRLRKRVPVVGAQVRACSVAAVRSELDAAGWDTVVATTNLVEPYRIQVSELITDCHCRVAVDVSCVPVLCEPPDRGRYIDLYDPRFAELVDRKNAAIADKAEKVSAAIAAHYAEC